MSHRLHSRIAMVAAVTAMKAVPETIVPIVTFGTAHADVCASAAKHQWMRQPQRPMGQRVNAASPLSMGRLVMDGRGIDDR